MFEYRQLALQDGLTWGSGYNCELMELWCHSFIAWVQSSLLIGCAGCKVFTNFLLVCGFVLCSYLQFQWKKCTTKKKVRTSPPSVYLLKAMLSCLSLGNAFCVIQRRKAVRKHCSKLTANNALRGLVVYGVFVHVARELKFFHLHSRCDFTETGL